MPYQLTLTFEDRQSMADTLNDLLISHHLGKVSIAVHLDEVTSSPFSTESPMDRREAEIREQLWGAKVKSKPAHMKRADKAARLAKMRMHAESRKAIDSFHCPTCGRDRFSNCESPKGNSLGNYAHKARRDLLDAMPDEAYGDAF